MKTVIQHVLSRLNEIGITDVFGVPGDFSFSVSDAIVAHEGIRWIGCCNELNAAYAADGYARVKGVAAVCTTFGVGELGANAGIAGSYAENLAVFHLVGMPSTATQASGALVHHSLGNGRFDVFHRMADSIVCASAVMTPDTVAFETEHLIAAALYHRRPVYMAFPADLADRPVSGVVPPLAAPRSDPVMLEAALGAIVTSLNSATSACMLPGLLCIRLGLQNSLTAVVEASNLPFATMFGDKSVLDEQHPSYIGMYAGNLMNDAVRAFVESCDRVLAVGTMMSDLNTAAFTAHLDPAKTITIAHHHIELDGKTYPNVEIGDVVAALAKRLPAFKPQKVPSVVSSAVPVAQPGPIRADFLYPRWEKFLREGDIVIADVGTVAMGMAFAKLPARAAFFYPALWNAIGWATPAAFGAAVAAGGRRVVLFTGEGGHQLTAQEISQFPRYGLRPVIFVLNNGGYLIERLLCKDPAIEYNDLSAWRYADLPKAFGCDDWHTARAVTADELDRELGKIGDSRAAAYIEVVTPPDEAPPAARKLHESVASLYGSGR